MYSYICVLCVQIIKWWCATIRNYEQYFIMKSLLPACDMSSVKSHDNLCVLVIFNKEKLALYRSIQGQYIFLIYIDVQREVYRVVNLIQFLKHVPGGICSLFIHFCHFLVVLIQLGLRAPLVTFFCILVRTLIHDNYYCLSLNICLIYFFSLTKLTSQMVCMYIIQIKICLIEVLCKPTLQYLTSLSIHSLAMAGVFESYEHQFATITADITARITKIPNLVGSELYSQTLC